MSRLFKLFFMFMILLASFLMPVSAQCDWFNKMEETNQLTKRLLQSMTMKNYKKVRPLVSRKQIDLYVSSVSRETGMNSDFIKAVIKTESGFNNNALSCKGAMGLMQLMPATCKDYRVDNPWDPRKNIDAGTRFLKSLIIEFKDVKKALAAYNFGPGNVRRQKRWPRETREYVVKVIRTYKDNIRKN